MITDITLGQYIPGNSVLHRLDPRTKILLTFAFIAAVFIVENIIGYVLIGFLLVLLIKASEIPFKFILKSLKPIYFFVIFTALLNIFMTDGKYIISFGIFHISREGVILAAVMALRLIFLVAGTSLLTYTTSPIVLTDGIEALLKPLEKLKFPAHERSAFYTYHNRRNRQNNESAVGKRSGF